MRKLFFYVPLALFLALTVFLLSGLFSDPRERESASLNKALPEFALADLMQPQQIWTPQQLKGETFLLNVWGTWCPACRDEHDDLVWLAEEKGVRIIGLNYKDNRDDALAWLRDLGNPYATSIYDPRGTLGFDLGVYGAPETYVIDAQGIVRYRHVGVVHEKVWNEDLEPLVSRYQEGS